MNQENEYIILSDRIAALDQDIASKAEEANEIVKRRVDADDETRTQLSDQWASLQLEIELLQAERKILQARRDHAFLVPFEEAVKAADEERLRLGTLASEAKKTLNEVANRRTRFYNRGGRRPMDEETEAERLKIDAEFATAQSTSLLAMQKAERARFEAEKARGELTKALALIEKLG